MAQGNAQPSQVPDPEMSPFTYAPPEATRAICSGLISAPLVPVFDLDDRILVYGVRRDNNRRGIHLVNSFGALAGMWNNIDTDVRDAVRLRNGQFLILVRDGRSLLLNHDGKPPGPANQRYFTGNHGLSNNLCGLAVRTNGQIVVADGHNRRLTLFGADGKFVSHHSISNAHIHNGRMNGFFMKDNDDIYLFIWSRGMPRIYQYHMNNNRAEEVFLDPPLKGSCVDFCFDVDGNLWILTQHCYLRVWDAQRRFISSFDVADPIFRVNRNSARVWRLMRMHPITGRIILADGVENVREIDSRALLAAARKR